MSARRFTVSAVSLVILLWCAPLWGEDVPALENVFGQPAILWGRYSPPLFTADATRLYMGTDQINVFDLSSGDWVRFWPFSSRVQGVGDPPFPGYIWSDVSGMAVGPDGSIYVLDQWWATIHCYDSSGDFLRGWGGYGDQPGQFPEHHTLSSICVSPHDSAVYVIEVPEVSAERYRIRRYDAYGNLLTAWEIPPEEIPRRVVPVEVAAADGGGVWLLSRVDEWNGFEWAPREAWVRRYSVDGREERKWRVPLDLVIDPTMGIASDSEGYVWSLKGGYPEWSLQRYTGNGKLTSQLTFTSGSPTDFAITPDSRLLLLVPQAGSFRVEMRSFSGDLLGSLGDAGDMLSRGALIQPDALAGTPSGETYARAGVVTYPHPAQSVAYISHYSPSGQLLETIQSDPKPSYEFYPRYNPTTGEVEIGVKWPEVIGPDGNLYGVWHSGGLYLFGIQKLAADGTVLATYLYQMPFQLQPPEYVHASLVLGPDGNLWLAVCAASGSYTDALPVWVGLITLDGALLREWQASVPLSVVESLAVDSGLNVYLGGKGGVWKLSQYGQPVGRVGGWGGDGDQRDAPGSLVDCAVGIAIDAAGRVRVLDTARHLLQFAYSPGPFPDVPYWHWAKDQIRAAANAGIVFGSPDGLYHPEYTVTRDQMAVFISRAIAATRSFCRFLFEEGRLETNPAQALRSIRLGPPLAPKHLTVEEVQRLLTLPDSDTPTGRRDRAILMLLYNTGLRVGELCALSREDVRLPAEGWGALQVVGKGRRLHRLPINRPAADALLAYLAGREDAEPALFLNRSGGRFSVRGIALLVNRYLRAAGITDRSGPHVLRHTFATHALRARPNLRAVQELLGHAWVTTTQRYTHLEVEDLQDQVAGLPANRGGGPAPFRESL